MRIAVTGATGLIGSALVDRLETAGDDVVRLVRRPPRASGEVRWDPTGGAVDVDGLGGVEAVVHLAGAGVGDHRWTPSYKQEIRDSRVLGTRTLVAAIKQLDPMPSVLVSGSAIGFYGSRGEELLTEESGQGSGFLAGVVRDWECEALTAQDLGVRVALARTGLVMAPSGGAFGRLLPLVRLGLGGPLGGGRQWWSWVSLADEVAALVHLVTGDLSGPVNLTSPQPQRNIDVTRALGRAVHRPTVVPAPAFALKVALGDFAEDVLASARVMPHQLLESGFTFEHETVDAAAAWVTAH